MAYKKDNILKILERLEHQKNLLKEEKGAQIYPCEDCSFYYPEKEMWCIHAKECLNTYSMIWDNIAKLDNEIELWKRELTIAELEEKNTKLKKENELLRKELALLQKIFN